jgi:hypothetical protein
MTVRGPFALAVRLHVVEHLGFQGVMGNAVSPGKHTMLGCSSFEGVMERCSVD